MIPKGSSFVLSSSITRSTLAAGAYPIQRGKQMRAFAKAIIAVGVLFFAVRAQADEGVPLKQLAPGTVFTFNSTGGSGGPTTLTVKVNKMDGVTIYADTEIASNGRKDSGEYVGFGAFLAQSRRETISSGQREEVATIFPLKVGNSVWSGHGGSGWMSQDHLEVTGTETVTVPAGTFDTIIIATSMKNGTFWWGNNTCWYSPEVGYCVKGKWRSSSTSSDTELVSIASP